MARAVSVCAYAGPSSAVAVAFVGREDRQSDVVDMCYAALCPSCGAPACARSPVSGLLIRELGEGWVDRCMARADARIAIANMLSKPHASRVGGPASIYDRWDVCDLVWLILVAGVVLVVGALALAERLAA